MTTINYGNEGIFVSKLTLTNFRCYGHTVVEPRCDHSLTILTGPNGAGKTNVLEAISYLAPGRGLRRAPLGDVTRKKVAIMPPEDALLAQRNGWAVAATLKLGSEPVKVGTGIEQAEDEANNKRLVRIDGEVAANSNILGERWSISWLTPQMDRLFVEGPASRRRFLDRMVLGLFPDHSRQVGAYERVMRERNRLLSDKGPYADPAWLNALETRMAEHGVAVAVARLEFAGQLAGQLAKAPESPFPRAELAIDGWLEGLLANGTSAVEVEDAFKARLTAARHGDTGNENGRESSRETSRGRANIGAHKTDLVVTHAPKAMRADLCSTGEQKALLVALVLANAQLQTALRGQAPLMLMDEVAAHLDRDRREALFDALASLGSQCWLTGTDKNLFKGLSGSAEFFDVSDGSIQSASI